MLASTIELQAERSVELKTSRVSRSHNDDDDDALRLILPTRGRLSWCSSSSSSSSKDHKECEQLEPAESEKK